MKIKALYIISIFMVVALAACGPTPEPTMSPADVQGTAVAAAWTVVAMTQVAIPTATLIPPTETPSPTALPTFTPLPPPTSEAFPTQSMFVGIPTNPPVAGGPTADACNLPISNSAAGQKVKTRIINKSGGSVVLSLYLSKTLFGECGIYHFNIDPKGSISVDLLEGSYYAGAFITGKQDTKAFGRFDLRGSSSTITITSDTIQQ
jgi:hypothetical protein